MTPAGPRTANPWAAGRLGPGGGGLMFGRMYEDPAVELAAFPHGSSVLCIASAGDTAMALAAAGHAVTAIDINPAQVAYVERRLAGEPAHAGHADRMLAAGRLGLRGAGWTRHRLELLSAMSDCDAQVAAWRQLTSGLPGYALRALLSPAALRLGYHRDFAHAASGLRHDLPRRIERALAVHPNRDNPWAQLLFTGRWPAACDAPPPAGSLGPAGVILCGSALLCGIGVQTEAQIPTDAQTHTEGSARLVLTVGDVAAHLEAVPRGMYGGFTLSNVLDGAPASYRRRLMAAVRRAAAPGAVIVLRSFQTAANEADGRAAARDRALIWGSLSVTTDGESP